MATVIAMAVLLLASAACRGDSSPTTAGRIDVRTVSAVEATVTASVALGRSLYERDCASCHGRRGEGQPEWWVARPDGTLPAPPHDSTGHTWHHTDDELGRIVADGGAIYMANSGMPAFGQRLGTDEVQAVLDYIKTMWGPRERAWQAERSLDSAAMKPLDQASDTPAP